MAVPVYATNDVPTATEWNTWFVNKITKVKSANETVTASTALQDDDELFLALTINSTYWVQGVLNTDGPNLGNIKVAFTIPTGASMLIHFNALGAAATDGTGDVVALTETSGSAASFGTITAGDHRPIHFAGQVTIASTAGNIQLRWAQDTSDAGNTRVLAGSVMWAERIL